MNNLIWSTLLLVAAGLAWADGYRLTRRGAREVTTLARRISQAEIALRAERAASSDIEQRLATTRESGRRSQEELELASAQARELTMPSDVTLEGAWPASRDYFYLPKLYLGTLGYGFFHNDGGLSDEAALLFGFTPAEKVALLDQWQQLRLDLERLQLQHAERLTPSQPDSDNHREISFRLPALTNEIDQINRQFAQNLEAGLGPTRGQLIWQKVSNEAPFNGFPMGQADKIVTYSADRNPDGTVRHSLAFTNPTRTASYQLPIQFDLEPNQALSPSEGDAAGGATVGVPVPLSPESALWNYRHLFGDQPLLQARRVSP